MNKKIIRLIPCIIFYVLAGLLAIYAMWSFSHSADIISQARAAGQLAASGNEFDIASFYMSNSGQYLIWALLLAAAGLILHRKPTVVNATAGSVGATEKNAVVDAELDEWFTEGNGQDK